MGKQVLNRLNGSTFRPSLVGAPQQQVNNAWFNISKQHAQQLGQKQLIYSLAMQVTALVLAQVCIWWGPLFYLGQAQSSVELYGAYYRTDMLCFYISWLNYRRPQCQTNLQNSVALASVVNPVALQLASYFVASWMLVGTALNIIGIFFTFRIIKGSYFQFTNLFILFSWLCYALSVAVFDLVVVRNAQAQRQFSHWQWTFLIAIFLQALCYLLGVYWLKKLVQITRIMELIDGEESVFDQDLDKTLYRISCQES